jgi:hypothetical protein
MSVLKRTVLVLLVTGLSTPAVAGDLLAATVHAAEQQAPAPRQQPMSKAYLWPGIALFAGGMTVAINGFLNNRNGKFPQFGEAESTNVRMGAAGLTAAFGGGLVLALGKHKAGRSPSITVGPGTVTVSKQVSW